jgi:mono/diheme cytochrome c family protein
MQPRGYSSIVAAALVVLATSVSIPALAHVLFRKPVPTFLGHALAQTAPAFTPRDEAPEQYPAGAGRDEAFYACTACHGFRLISEQGLTRGQWEESIALMTQKHNMPALPPKEQEVVLKYLEAAFPPRAPSRSGGWQNPFLKQ